MPKTVILGMLQGHTVPVKKINEKESDDYMAPSEVAHRRLPVSCEPIVVALAHALRRDERTDEAMQVCVMTC